MMRSIFALGICWVALTSHASAQVGYQGAVDWARDGWTGQCRRFCNWPVWPIVFQNSSNFGLNAGPESIWEPAL